MAVLALTNVYLDAEQKKALTKRAKLKGTNLSVEVRNAVDSYLAGVTVDELQMLDAATRQAGEHIDEMNAILDAGLKRSEAFFKEIAALKGKLASAQGDELLTQAVDVKGLKVLAATLAGADAKTLRETMDKLKDKLKTAAIVLASVDGEKVQIAAGVTADSVGKVKAGELVNFVAQQVGGKGGGKADMAMAGGTQAAALPQALASVSDWVAARL